MISRPGCAIAASYGTVGGWLRPQGPRRPRIAGAVALGVLIVALAVLVGYVRSHRLPGEQGDGDDAVPSGSADRDADRAFRGVFPDAILRLTIEDGRKFRINTKPQTGAI